MVKSQTGNQKLVYVCFYRLHYFFVIGAKYICILILNNSLIVHNDVITTTTTTATTVTTTTITAWLTTKLAVCYGMLAYPLCLLIITEVCTSEFGAQGKLPPNII